MYYTVEHYAWMYPGHISDLWDYKPTITHTTGFYKTFYAAEKAKARLWKRLCPVDLHKWEHVVLIHRYTSKREAKKNIVKLLDWNGNPFDWEWQKELWEERTETEEKDFDLCKLWEYMGRR